MPFITMKMQLIETMQQGKFFLGVIPARSGSKRIKDKNIKPLHGKPLIAYTIESALKSKLLDACIVSTDSERIAEVSRQYGASVPFIRPKKLAKDESRTAAVLRHAVKSFESLCNKMVDCAVLLQPSSPFRKAEHIDRAIREFSRERADSLFSVSSAKDKQEFLVYLKSGRLEFPRNAAEMRQCTYTLNGAIYIYNRKTLFSRESYPRGKKSILFEMPREYSADIDTMQEWKRAAKMAGKFAKKGRGFAFCTKRDL